MGTGNPQFINSNLTIKRKSDGNIQTQNEQLNEQRLAITRIFVFLARNRSKAEIETNMIEVVKNLLSANRFIIAEIATYASVTEGFVEEFKKTLN